SDDAFANFPRLEETLKLDCCYPCTRIGTHVLKVTGSKLLNLEIDPLEFNSLEIVAPKLQSLSLTFELLIQTCGSVGGTPTSPV
ncbi:hypothetical protein LINPERHAP1_LOCUS34530, partial [Linum perenne]